MWNPCKNSPLSKNFDLKKNTNELLDYLKDYVFELVGQGAGCLATVDLFNIFVDLVNDYVALCGFRDLDFTIKDPDVALENVHLEV